MSKRKQRGATELMKLVAAKAPDDAHMKKVFTRAELEEVQARRRASAEKKKVADADKIAARKEYRQNKHWLLDMEAENDGTHLYAIPSFPVDEGWYKMADGSALYYAYHIAPLLRRKVTIMADTDRKPKAERVVSIQKMERLCEQFVELELGTVAKGEGGVMIFTLNKPPSEDEWAGLWQVEETRREAVRALIKPDTMSPAVYNSVLGLARQVIPRANKLDGRYFSTMGVELVDRINDLMVVYFRLSAGEIKRLDAKRELLVDLNKIAVIFSMLAELRVWQYDSVTMMAETLRDLRKVIGREFSSNEMNNEG